MNETAFWAGLSNLFSVLTVALYLLTFVDGWRLPTRRARGVMLALIALAATLTLGGFAFIRPLYLAGAVVVAGHLAALAGMVLLAQWRGGRLLFILATAFLGSGLPFYATATTGLGDLAVQILIQLGGFCLVRRYFRRWLTDPRLGNKTSWPLLALVPLSFNAMHLYVLFHLPESSRPGGQLSLPGVQDPALQLLMIVLPCASYYVVYRLFYLLEEQYRGEQERLILHSHLMALEHQDVTGHEGRERDRVFYQGLDLFLAQVERQIDAGDLSDAHQTLEQVETGLDAATRSAKKRVYTGEAIVDAVLNDYEQRAVAHGVELSIHLSLPSEKKLDCLGLAVALSNALENAMNACMAMPPGTPRRIVFTSDATARRLVIEIRNTYAGPVSFDPMTGLPASTREGHGYGTRSIAAFVRAGGGVLEYEAEDGWFILRMMI